MRTGGFRAFIAIAGPLVSFALTAFFYLLSGLSREAYEPASVAFGWPGFINLLPATFNLIPGFPLDGGRVFRAVVWGLTGDARKGIRWAVNGGRIVGWIDRQRLLRDLQGRMEMSSVD